MKSFELLWLLPRRPQEFLDRTSAVIATRWEAARNERPHYRAVGVEEAFASIQNALAPDVSLDLRRETMAQIEAQVRQRQGELPPEAPFARFHDGDAILGRLCFRVASAIRAESIVETGVCYGVTSSYLLQALKANGAGHLHSIDLPPLGKHGDDYVGWLIPEELRSRWSLHRGTSRRLLGSLLDELGPIDLFVHDSLHTYRNMKMEFALAWPALRKGGVLISDDVHGNEAFLELSRLRDVSFSVVIQERGKDALLGVAVKKA